MKGRYSGVFDVVIDGKVIWSKKTAGRFPEPGEVARLVAQAGLGKSA